MREFELYVTSREVRQAMDVLDVKEFETRKRDHIQVALDPQSQTTEHSFLDQVRLIHDALPEIDFEEVDLAATCLGRPVATPFFVCGMTAGHPDADIINTRIAQTCEERGWSMGLGSQRRDLTSSDIREDWRTFRRRFPRLRLFGNVGISQLADLDFDRIQQLVDEMKADGFCVHANALQEAIQPEGTPHFKGAIEALGALCKTLDVPVILKETGSGFSAVTLKKLRGVGLAAIDVSGLGGTHWGRAEGLRLSKQDVRRKVSQTFAGWGSSTVESVLSAKRVLPRLEIWASGGVRSGLDAAKLLALGAHRVGFAQPALKAALEGPMALEAWMQQMEYELKVALFCTGSRNVKQLRGKKGAWSLG